MVFYGWFNEIQPRDEYSSDMHTQVSRGPVDEHPCHGSGLRTGKRPSGMLGESNCCGC